MLPAAIFTALVHYIAVGAGGVVAFTDWTGIGSFNFIGLDNFVEIFSNDSGRLALINSFVIAVVFVIGTNLIGFSLAIALNRGVKSRYVLRTIFFAPVVLSPLATAYIWQFIFQFDGPLNSIFVALGWEELQRAWTADPSAAIWTVIIVMLWQSSGLVMVMYLAGLTGVPLELEEAAALDGAGFWRRLTGIVLPLIRPAFVIASTLTLIQGLRVFDQIFALTGGGPFGVTETLATQVYKQTFVYQQYGYGAAMSLLLTVLILVLALIQNAAARGKED